MHQIKGAGLSKLINNYNTTQAGTLTPAGQALVAAKLFTAQELVELNAVKQPLAQAPLNPLQNAAFRTLDLSVSYPIKLTRFREGLSLIPGVAMYNVGNLSNFGGFGGLASAADAGTAAQGNLNGANTSEIHDQNRTQRGTGTFDQGAPRSTEFQLKFNF